ncbi:hypothetical protein ANO11243_064100 [Dothideomycetidae sp. 11243]|nr:hypothetical protein ANO11243_064100 [fungal sp. No.11243]
METAPKATPRMIWNGFAYDFFNQTSRQDLSKKEKAQGVVGNNPPPAPKCFSGPVSFQRKDAAPVGETLVRKAPEPAHLFNPSTNAEASDQLTFRTSAGRARFIDQEFAQPVFPAGSRGNDLTLVLCGYMPLSDPSARIPVSKLSEYRLTSAKLFLPQERSTSSETQIIITSRDPSNVNDDESLLSTSKKPRRHVSSIRLNKDSIDTDIKIRKLVKGSARFATFSQTPEEELARIFARGGVAFECTIETCKSPNSSAINTDHDPSRPHFDLTTGLASIISGPTTIRFITDDPEIEHAVQVFNELLHQDQEKGYAFSSNFDPDDGKLKLDISAANRGTTAIRAPLVFQNEQEFICHNFMGSIIANDSAAAKNRRRIVLRDARIALDPAQSEVKIVRFFVLFKSCSLDPRTSPPHGVGKNLQLVFSAFAKNFDSPVDDDRWRGQVIQPLPFQPKDYSSIVVQRAAEHDPYEIDNNDVSLPTEFARECAIYTKFKSEADFEAYLSSSRAHTVRISGAERAPSNSSYSYMALDIRQRFKSERIYSKNESITWALLSGQNFNIQPIIDFFFGIDASSISRVKEGTHTTQRAFIDSLSVARAGLALPVGPSDSTSKAVMKAVEIFGHHNLAPEFHAPRWDADTKPPSRYTEGRPFDGIQHMPFRGDKRDHCLMGIASTTNLDADALAHDINERLTALPDKQHVVVIRICGSRSNGQTRSAVQKILAPLRKFKIVKDDELFLHELNEAMAFAMIMMTPSKSQQALVAPWRDLIIKARSCKSDPILLSLSFNILCVMGLIPDSLEELPEVQERLKLPMCSYQNDFLPFLTEFEEIHYLSGELGMDPDECSIVRMSEVVTQAAAHVLRHADAIVSTVAIFRQPKFYEFTRLHVIAVVQATQADNIDLLGIWTYHPSAQRIILAGNLSERPQDSGARSCDNIFAHNRKISLVLRFVLNGFPVTIFQ